MEEDFYASVKLVSGEEIFGEVMPSEENGRTVLIVSDPVEIETVSMDGRHEGLRMMPWLRSMPNENIVIIPMDRVITVVEAREDSEVVRYYQKFILLSNSIFRCAIKLNEHVVFINIVRTNFFHFYNGLFISFHQTIVLCIKRSWPWKWL